MTYLRVVFSDLGVARYTDIDDINGEIKKNLILIYI